MTISDDEYLRAELAVVELFVRRGIGRRRRDHDAPTAGQIAESMVAIERQIGARRVQSPVAMDLLRTRLGLSLSEQRALWTLIAFDLDPHLRSQIREAASEPNAGVTLGTILSLVYDDTSPNGLLELGINAPLATMRLVEIESTDAPVSQRRIRVADRVLELATGVARLDPRVVPFAKLELDVTGIDQLELEAQARHDLVDAIATDASGLVIACGRTGSGRRSALIAASLLRERRVLSIDARRLAPKPDLAEDELRRAARECRLLGVTPLFCHLDALGSAGDAMDRFDLLESCFDGMVLATSTRPIARRWKRPAINVELPPITSTQREALWARALPMASRGDAQYLASTYPLAPALIDAVGRATTTAWGERGELTHTHFAAGIRTVLDDRLAGLATRLTVTQEWADLVLPEDQTYAMRELLARIRERRRVYEDWKFADKVGKGLGVSALFSGPPGTGKSMAAGLIAKSLDLEIYQVDLSKIVSKWIGETEKNLAALFDAAEAGYAILLFDEADALFGKRTSVQSSNDRHANQEINYLLQRMEHFAGICLLTTNHDAAIDEAFRRRLSSHVRFPLPDADERERLWAKLLTNTAPVEGSPNLSALAHTYVMSGGYIRNAVLRAAFLAADAASPITEQLLQRAAQLEYEAMGKIVASTV